MLCAFYRWLLSVWSVWCERHLKNWHSQHCHRGELHDNQRPNRKCPALNSQLSSWESCWHTQKTAPEEEVEQELTPGESRARRFIFHFEETWDVFYRSDINKTPRMIGEKILNTVKCSSGKLAHNAVREKSKHNYQYFFFMSQCDKTQLLLVFDPQRG